MSGVGVASPGAYDHDHGAVRLRVPGKLRPACHHAPH